MSESDIVRAEMVPEKKGFSNGQIAGMICGLFFFMFLVAAIFQAIEDSDPAVIAAKQAAAKQAADAKAKVEEERRIEQAHADYAAAKRRREADRELFFRSQSEEDVKRVLKYPNDASFSWGQEIKKLNDNSYAAYGTVTAKNAFGGEFKKNYRVMFYSKDGTNWATVLIELDGVAMYSNLDAMK